MSPADLAALAVRGGLASSLLLGSATLASGVHPGWSKYRRGLRVATFASVGLTAALGLFPFRVVPRAAALPAEPHRLVAIIPVGGLGIAKPVGQNLRVAQVGAVDLQLLPMKELCGRHLPMGQFCVRPGALSAMKLAQLRASLAPLGLVEQPSCPPGAGGDAWVVSDRLDDTGEVALTAGGQAQLTVAETPVLIRANADSDGGMTLVFETAGHPASSVRLAPGAPGAEVSLVLGGVRAHGEVAVRRAGPGEGGVMARLLHLRVDCT